jgi:multidrug efflux pump subunit AcrB
MSKMKYVKYIIKDVEMMGINFLTTIVKKRKITLSVLVMVILLGVYSYIISPKQEAPIIEPPAAIIYSIYPGASPYDMDKLVTTKIEESLSEMEGYSYCVSNSKNGFSTVITQFNTNIDFDKTQIELKDKMKDLENTLPEEAKIVNVNTDLMKTSGMMFTLSGENASNKELFHELETIKSDLIKVEGVTSVDIVGNTETEIRVEVDLEKLDNLPISMTDLSNILFVNNVEIPSGSVKSGKEVIIVKTNGKYSNKSDIENTIVGVNPLNGKTIKLNDIATIKEGMKDSDMKYKYKRDNALVLVGYFDKDKNIINIGKEIDKKIKAIESNLPNNMNLNRTMYQPTYVENSINIFVNNLLLGMLLVIIVVFLSLGIRNALIVSISIPITIFVTFIIMRFLDIEFQKISISALIIALGMLVDNAIVVSEVIKRKIDLGDEKMKACVDGTREVAIPMLSSTLTTVAAFIPLLMLDSIVGSYIKSLPQVIIVALVSSYLVALTVTPTISYILAKKSKKIAKVSLLNRGFIKILQTTLRYKFISIIIIAGFGIVAFFSYNQLGLKFFPKVDKDVVYIDVFSDQSMNLEETDKLNIQVLDILDKYKEVIDYTSAIGTGLPKFWDTLFVGGQNLDYSQVLVKLDLSKTNKYKTNTEFVDAIQKKFDEELENGRASAVELEQGQPINAPINIRVSGDNFDEINKVCNEYKNALEKIDGTMNVRDNYPNKSKQYVIDFDNNNLSDLEINKVDIQNEINIALMGQVPTIIKNQGKETEVKITSEIEKIDELKKLKIKTGEDKKVKLGDIADIRLVEKISQINKYDNKYNISIYSDLKIGYSSAKIENELNKKMKNVNLDKVEVTFAGEQDSIKDSFGDIGVLAVFAAIAVFIILLVQFSSYIQPLIILVSVPLSSIGSLLGLYITKNDISFTALLGIVSLLGIVVNNAIILIDYINKEIKNGADINDACIIAVEKRFRPIMVTTLTTIIALTPLIFRGGSLFSPLAIAIISGLLFSTILTIIVIPVFYSFVESKIESF